MNQLGIMAYPDLTPMEQIRAYMKLASRYGFTRVISSMLSVEGSNEEIMVYFREFISTAHSFGLEVSLDVNTGFMTQFGQSYDDISLFHHLGCDVIRLDGSYGPEHDYILTRNPYGIKVEMNASSHRVEEEISYFNQQGVSPDQVYLCHNAYPLRYTGLKWQDFLNKNHRLRKYGYKIAAIISSNAPNTLGVWGARDGLPTVERLRDLPIDLQARIILATGEVDDLIIGNCFASEEEFQSLADALKPPRDIQDSPVYQKILAYGPQTPVFGPLKRLRVILAEDITSVEKENLLDMVPQLDNGDSSEWIWRSRCCRLVNGNRPIPPRQDSRDYFPPGSILIVNDRYRRYSGEIHIARLPILNDGMRNYIGSLAPHEEMLLDLIHANDLVEFMQAK